MRVTIGVDVGQVTDPTAIVVTEMQWRETPEEVRALTYKYHEDHHVVRHLERLPLGTGYGTIMERIADIARQVRDHVRAANLANRAGWVVQRDHAEIQMFVDATGVGQPVVDMLALSGVPATGVFFNHGDKRIEHPATDTVKYHIVLGKGYMVSGLQALMQTGRVHLPLLPETEQMARELRDFQIKVNDKANEQMGAFRVGTHDDYVTALGLSCVQSPNMVATAVATGGHVPAPVPDWAGGAGALAAGGHGIASNMGSISGTPGLALPNPFRRTIQPQLYTDLQRLGHRG